MTNVDKNIRERRIINTLSEEIIKRVPKDGLEHPFRVESKDKKENGSRSVTFK